MIKLQDFKKLFRIDEDSFETYLNYERYEHGIFWMKDRCFFIVNILGGVFYYSPASDLAAFYEKMETVLRSIPRESDASIQTVFLPHRDIHFDPPAPSTKNEFVKSAYYSITNHIKAAAKNGYFDSNSTLRDIKNLLIVIFPIVTQKPNYTVSEDTLNRVLSWKQAFIKSLQLNAVQFEEYTVRDFLYSMFTLLNQDFDPVHTSYVPSERLARQLLYNVVTTHSNGISYQDKHWILAYVHSINAVKPGMLVELMTLQRPFFVSSVLHPISPERLQAHLKWRHMSEVTNVRRVALQELIEEVKTKNIYETEIIFGFLINNPTEAEIVKAELTNFTAEYQWNVWFETQIAQNLFVSALPGHFNETAKRSIRIFEEHAVSLLNFRNFRSEYSKKGTILISEDLSPKYLSVFDSNAYGTLISGGSGSGKTFFAQYDLMSSLANGERVIVIDPLGNFESLCSMIGGIYHKLGVSKHASGIDLFPQMTPAEYAENKQPIILVIQTIEKLVKFGDRSAVLSASSRESLEKALDYMYTSSVSQNLATYIDILEAFNKTNKDKIVENVIASLKPFLPGKTYGNLFSNDTLSTDNDLVVFDVSEIKEERELLKLAIFALMSKISSVVVRDPGRKKKVYIDEAHYLANDPDSVSIIKDGVRVWRTMNGAMILITQQITDMLENREVGSGIFKTIENFFILSQSATSIREGREYIGYNSGEQKALNELRTLPGKYSMISFYTRSHISDGNPAFGRFYLAPPRFLYWTFTTFPAEKAIRQQKIQEFMQQGLSKEVATARAIQFLVDYEEQEKQIAAQKEAERFNFTDE